MLSSPFPAEGGSTSALALCISKTGDWPLKLEELVNGSSLAGRCLLAKLARKGGLTNLREMRGVTVSSQWIRNHQASVDVVQQMESMRKRKGRLVPTRT